MAQEELPTTTFRVYAHAFGFHHYTPWMIATATYQAGPLLRMLDKGGPNEWKEDVQVRHCRICKVRKLRRLG